MDFLLLVLGRKMATQIHHKNPGEDPTPASTTFDFSSLSLSFSKDNRAERMEEELRQLRSAAICNCHLMLLVRTMGHERNRLSAMIQSIVAILQH